jgi:LPS-assembly protein
MFAVKISTIFVALTAITVTVNAIGAIKKGLTDKDKQNVEKFVACVPNQDAQLTPKLRQQIAQLLGWQDEPYGLCRGYYKQHRLDTPPSNKDTKISADSASLYIQGRSTLTGNVLFSQPGRQASANTAIVYRNTNAKQIDKIELIGCVHYFEPGSLMVAKSALINPNNKSGQINEVIYRFNKDTHQPIAAPELHGLNAWGRAFKVERFENGDFRFVKASYTTCPPKTRGWEIQAKKIIIDKKNATGQAYDATLRIRDWPILYIPYLSFPTENKRKSGFLMPQIGYSSQGGTNFGTPYYLNLAPNYDATLIPQLFTKRGVALGGQFRYLTPNSQGDLKTNFLPNDRAFKKFINSNSSQFPQLLGTSNDRYLAAIHSQSLLSHNLRLDIDFQQVSDNYYLQDFSNTLSLITENQLPRQAALAYMNNNWNITGLVQNYQTLNPINQTPTANIYSRLPQLIANGNYSQLPGGLTIFINSSFDYFQWPISQQNIIPQGPRYHINPIIQLPINRIWGFLIPSISLQENYYDLSKYLGQRQSFNRFIPQSSIDGGLFFERDYKGFKYPMTQTLEPRIYYLHVPFVNQTPIPVFDATNYIFTFDQLFRPNRFSGTDRIGDANQLSYALTSRILTASGAEKIILSLGQIAYFRNRTVQLCQNFMGFCLDSPTTTLGYLSPVAKFSPIVGKFGIHLNNFWTFNSNIAWDVSNKNTNNSNVGFHYEPEKNHILDFGYTYLVNGDLTRVANFAPDNNALHQIRGSFAWPFNVNWSSLGAVSYNISKRYTMAYLLGIQFEDCCWAARLVGGRVFTNLNNSTSAQFSNSIYLQILFKGLGTIANSDPTSTIATNISGYRDLFREKR